MAALDFPTSPTVGQKYPASPVAGVPTFTWDGEKWSALTGGYFGVGAQASDTLPVGAPDNTLWFESDTGLLYIRYNDGSSTQWVIASPQPDTTTFLLKPVASKADQQTGTSAVAAVTPSQQHQHDSAIKAHASFTGSTGAILSGFNIASITRASAGIYNVVFTVPFATANYTGHVTAEVNGNASDGIICFVNGSVPKTATGCQVRFLNLAVSAAVDPTVGHIMFCGRQ